MARLLIIDDDEMICNTMSRVFTDKGHDIVYALNLEQGLKTAKSGNFDVVFMDVRLPDGNGLSHIGAIQTMPSSPEVIIITGYADPDGAELAIKNNAWDYIRKPASIDAVNLVLNRALQYREEKQACKATVTLRHMKREGIIGDSPEILRCLDLVARAGNSNANILITGETGTGKELFSRAIHMNSARADKNFVVVDCAALPKNLIENILFGHEKGAFTSADRAEEGLIKQAHNGTLFLDEIGELPLSTQKTFLRVLQERRFRPLGGTQEIRSNFRLVSASNRNLEKMVETGQFRSDLLFRIRSVTISLPPLRERKTDIKSLAVSYLMSLCESHNIGMKGFSPDFFEVLASYPWPGNIRELHSALEWAVAQALYDPTLFPKHLPPGIRIQVARSSFETSASDALNQDQAISENALKRLPKWHTFRRSLVDDGERRYLTDLMDLSEGNIKKASQYSGLSQPRLYELLRKHKISAK